MRINEKYYIDRKRDGSIMTNLFDRDMKFDPSDDKYASLERIAQVVNKRSYSIETKNKFLERFLRISGWFDEAQIQDRLATDAMVEMKKKIDAGEVCDKNLEKKVKLEALKNLANFFSEFQFTPGARFVNTLCITDNVNAYVANYFLLQDHSYATEIIDKIKSDEFKQIVDALKSGSTPKVINNRMKLYFGAPGSGKTTEASQETQNIIVCTSDMLPKDIMNVFGFDEGNPEFKKSTLRLAMENGEKIVLDEINMLPFETLRFIQGLTDGKETFKWENEEIVVKDGFQIIGTMNLTVNGETYSIPEPLIDRCCELKEFKLDAKDLLQFTL